jgi:arylsulfatase A-like enzyme
MARISRRSFLRTVVFGSAALAIKGHSAAQLSSSSATPNLIVFLPDELRADLIIGGATDAVHAPSLHRLASQSVIFEKTYITQPICAPSRSSLLAGTWPHQTGCTNNDGVLPRNFLCLPEMVGDSDYVSGYFGKWHLGDEFLPQHGFSEWASILESFKPVERESHAERCLDELASLVEPSKPPVSEELVPKASDYTRFLISKGYQPDAYRGRYFSEKFASQLPFELTKARFVETRACEFLQRHFDRPFIMFVAFFEPHPPYYGPFNNEHPLVDIRLDATAQNLMGDDMPLRYRLRQQLCRKRYRAADAYRRTKRNYLGLITQVDRCIGNIVQKIEDLGIAGRTITVVTSDHGDMMSAHELVGKGVMYEQASAVPYLVRVPGIDPHRISQPVSHIDFAPTMLDLLGKPPHRQCMGRSKAPLLRKEALPPESVFMEWSPGKEKVGNLTRLAGKEEIQKALKESTRSVITPDGWKLCLRDRDKNELYNLKEDPDERRNLYPDAGHKDTVMRLTDEIRQWQQRVGDAVKV